MVDADEDNVTGLGDVVAIVVGQLHGGTVGEPAAMQEDDDRLARLGVERVGPHVQVLAVLILDEVMVSGRHELGEVRVAVEAIAGGADGAPGDAGAGALPRFHLFGHLETLGSGVGDAAEAVHALVVDAHDPATFDGGKGKLGRLGVDHLGRRAKDGQAEEQRQKQCKFPLHWIDFPSLFSWIPVSVPVVRCKG